ncbi:MerR family transcriptional regulator [Spirillospora sp. NPDC029432]|uniref:MerR family transcriptional regulator n=1 Tax=Spirillospora sp. NPDC029432 TaxID=3154599 RepID=UPI0034521C1F
MSDLPEAPGGASGRSARGRRSDGLAEGAEHHGVDVGLFVGPVRRVGGHRVYDERDLEWLHLCTRLRASGMPVTLIREYAALVRDGAGTVRDRLALLRRHQERLEARIEELRQCSALVAHKVALYEAQLADDGQDPFWSARG